MSGRVFDPLRLDVQALAGDAGELGGAWPLRQFGRLADMLHAEAPPVDADVISWSARGEQRAARGAPAQNWLHLQARTNLKLECQRCLQPVPTDIALDRWFHFVPGEDAAAQLDADSEDDVLALTRALDLRELVEDELLLALPLVPRHSVCPAPLRAPGEAADLEPDPVHPFAALAALKQGGPLN